VGRTRNIALYVFGLLTIPIMTKVQAKNRIDKLKKVINYHRYLYHILDKQEISDAVLDSLKHELFELEQEFPDLQTNDSPTQRVGGRPLDKFNKIEHRTAMLSIEDIFNRDELEKWQEYLKRLAPSDELSYFCELKIDGLALSLIYENGSLIKAATRGDGKVGEDVLQNIKTIESIPLALDIFKKIKNIELEKRVKEMIGNKRIEIRGEIYMDKKSFELINKKREKEGENQYANPRNLAAGSIRQLNPELASSRNLKFLAYDIASDIPSDIGIFNHSDKHWLLSTLGLKAEKGTICDSLQKIDDFWQESAKKREKLPYQIDGIVITTNNNLLFKKLGVAGKSPRGVRALKFPAKQTTTKVEDIKIQIGRTGVATPVAFLKPANISGSTITRATLHNKDQIERLGIKIGDTVIVERAGDVIPAVIKVLKELRTGKERPFKFPKKCPSCDAKLVNLKGEVAWRCPNSHCSAQRNELLEHFVSKKSFNIEGLGPKIMCQLTNNGLIVSLADIFDLEESDLAPLERFAEKSAKNLIQEIQISKKIPLNRFIFSLGIRHIGEKTARDLADEFRSIEKLKNASIQEISAIPNVGNQASKSIYNWFRQKENIELIAKIKSRGVKIILPKAVGTKLKGKSFVVTGSFASMSRDMAYQLIRDNGGEVLNSLSKNTDFLIKGDNAGQKLKQAEQLEIKTINEQEFLKMINNQ